MKILIAEDEPMMLAALRKNLEDDGYEVITATDGQQAIEQYEAARPDLIITDLMMPFTSGLEVISVVKSPNGSKTITPVIVLSGIGEEATVMEAFNRGADDFIIKPFSPTDLSIRVKKMLRRSNTSNAVE